jgi:hypothetical protein
LTPPDHTTHWDSTADLPEPDARRFLTAGLWSCAVLLWRIIPGASADFPTYGMDVDIMLLFACSLLANLTAPTYEHWQRSKLMKRWSPADHVHMLTGLQQMMDRVTPVPPLFAITSILTTQRFTTSPPPADTGTMLAAYLTCLAMADAVAFLVRHYVQGRRRAAATSPRPS